ncbi:MAG: insulinase family protein [Saprospiraceae bacterium]|nr:insulinase family protein [Saprospiraceae bacterium]
MPNRTQAPAIKRISSLELPKPEVFYLENGIPVYANNLGTQDVVRMEMVFFAGRPYEKERLAARSTASLLKEGSKNFSADQIAEELDFWGCSLGTPFNLDTSNITVHSLRKHFGKVLPIVADLLQNPLFPSHELSSFIRRNQQSLKMDLTKNDVIAYRKITEFIFGNDHPYGYNSYPETYSAVTRMQILDHFNTFYRSNNCIIFLSGRVDDQEIKLLNQYLGNVLQSGDIPYVPVHAPEKIPGKVKIHNPGTIQTAIRVGRHLFNRNHPDYKGMYFLNTVLGGYFGSRLMANIREDKGYTYNIYSSLDPMVFDGCFYMGTEVSTEFTDKTIQEIYNELDKLCQERIGEDELDMVKNYLLGNFLTMLDGPFNVSEVIKTIITEELPITFFEELVEVVQSITADELRDLAQKYLRKEDMWEVIVGS